MTYHEYIPSGKQTENYGKSQCLIRNLTMNGHVQYLYQITRGYMYFFCSVDRCSFHNQMRLAEHHHASMIFPIQKLAMDSPSNTNCMTLQTSNIPLAKYIYRYKLLESIDISIVNGIISIDHRNIYYKSMNLPFGISDDMTTYAGKGISP